MDNKDKFPELTVSGVIFNSRNQILLCKSHKWDDKYVIPGGHVEYGERLEDALKRELLEETGLRVHSIELLGIKECFYSNEYYEDRHFLFMDYTCKTDDTIVVLNDESEDFIWVQLSEVKKYPLGGYVASLLSKLDESTEKTSQACVFYNY